MMEIRRMTIEDLEEVVALEKAIFSQPWSKQGFFDTLAMENTYFLSAVEDGHVTGYAGMYVAADEGEITNVAVASEQRGRGIGNLLIAGLNEEAKKRKLTHVILEVRVSNEAAISLYKKHGYQVIGERRNFYEMPKEDALVMSYEI